MFHLKKNNIQYLKKSLLKSNISRNILIFSCYKPLLNINKFYLTLTNTLRNLINEIFFN